MYSETQGSLNLQYTNENLYYIEFISYPSYPAITMTYFMSNTSTSKNPINLKSQHNRNQSRSGSEVHLRKLITNLRFSRFKKSNEFGLSSYQGSRSGFFIRGENWSIRKKTSFQLSLTLGRGGYICYNSIYVDNLNELLIIHQGWWYPHKLLDTDKNLPSTSSLRTMTFSLSTPDALNSIHLNYYYIIYYLLYLIFFSRHYTTCTSYIYLLRTLRFKYTLPKSPNYVYCFFILERRKS